MGKIDVIVVGDGGLELKAALEAVKMNAIVVFHSPLERPFLSIKHNETCTKRRRKRKSKRK